MIRVVVHCAVTPMGPACFEVRADEWVDDRCSYVWYGEYEPLLAVLKPNRIIRKRTDANYSSFHLIVFLRLSNPSDRGKLSLYLTA
jgi:hypothetical protein